MRFTSMVCAMVLLLCGGCAKAADPWVEVAGHRIEVELATTDEARARGLMFRDVLADGHGMLFIHDQRERLAYWMKNTRIPLDILYFDEDMQLVSQQRDVPPCSAGDRCPAYPSYRPALYVLELNAGQASALGLEDGALIKFGPGVPTAPAQ